MPSLVGNKPNQVPTNGDLGTLAFQDASNIAAPVVIGDNSTNAALRITQLGTGNALLVEDSANPDATPFVITSGGIVVEGNTSPVQFARSQTTTSGANTIAGIQAVSSSTGAAQIGTLYYSSTTASAKTGFVTARSRGADPTTKGALLSGDVIGALDFSGDDGTDFISAAQIIGQVDGTTGTNDMPGRLVFSTTADGASSPTERMRIDSAGRIGIGSSSLTGINFRLATNITGATSSSGFLAQQQIQSDVTGSANIFTTFPSTQATSFTVGALRHYYARQSTIGATSSVTSQFGFAVESSLTGATNNYGFYSDIASGTGRYNFYANGTADNYFTGNTTIAGTTTLGASVHTGLGVSTGSALIELGNLRTGDGNAYIDFHSVAGGDYQARILKTGGANSSFNITNEGTGILALNQVGAGVITFNTNNSERMRVNSVGQIAVSSTGSASAPVISKSDDLNTGIFFPAADTIAFAEGGTESMRLDSNGNVLVGTTTSGAGIGFATKLAVDAGNAEGVVFKNSAGASAYTQRIWNSATTGDNLLMWFGTDAGNTRGSITYNRGAGLVAYNTSSDYRLKENIVDLPNALETVAQLKPRQFDWKETGNTTTGFIAHELAEVLPHAVTGEKDAVDSEGNPVYQGIDTSFLVATLTAAIKELKAEVDSLKAQLNK